VQVHAAVELAAEQAVELVANVAPCECLLLQGRPIGEPWRSTSPS
jgi:hypothetical protein